MRKFASSQEARARVLELAVQAQGSDVGLQCWGQVRHKGDAPTNWSGPFVLACLQEAELTRWKWRPGLGFTYRLVRVDQPRLADVLYFDVFEAMSEEFELPEVPEGARVGKVPTGARPINLRRAQLHGGPFYALLLDVLPGGVFRVVIGDRHGEVAVCNVDPDKVTAFYSLGVLVDQFDVSEVQTPEPEPVETEPSEPERLMRTQPPEPDDALDDWNPETPRSSESTEA